MKKEQMIKVLVITMIFVLAMTSIVLGVDPGVKMGSWIQRNVAGVFVGLIAVVGITLVITKQFMKLLVGAIIVGIASIFVYNGTEFGQAIGNIILGWFR